ncbi:MAG: NAD-binding protein [Longimicrobiales bacterium]|nr:NAD-binding protein [Longimicrobiales bacterium]
MAFALVYMAAVLALSSGVGVSERDLSDAGISTLAYYALGLFVLGGMDLGTPTGGGDVARSVLWFTYFAAPLITASALVEAVLRLLVPLARRVRPPTDHVILAGAGRLSRLYLQELRKRDRNRSVIIVEQDRNHPAFGELRDYERVQLLRGDITSDRVLRGLNLPEAHRVLLLTGDDFANLDAAAKALKLAPGLAGKIVAHVSELGFMRQTARSSVARDCDVFNGHQFAATRLVREHLAERFRRTPYRDLVVLAGFGRFGQTVLHELQGSAPGMFGPVVILDERASKNARHFEEEPGFSDDYERRVVDGDILDPDVWRDIEEAVNVRGRPPVIIIGSGEDRTNLHAALAVGRTHPDALIIVRSFRSSPFMEEVIAEVGAHRFNLGELIVEGMPESWF